MKNKFEEEFIYSESTDAYSITHRLYLKDLRELSPKAIDSIIEHKEQLISFESPTLRPQVEKLVRLDAQALVRQVERIKSLRENSDFNGFFLEGRPKEWIYEGSKERQISNRTRPNNGLGGSHREPEWIGDLF